MGSLDECALLEAGSGAYQRDQVWGVDRAPPGLGGLDQLERHRDPGRARAGPLGDPLTEPDGGEVDSIGLVVRRWIQCSAG